MTDASRQVFVETTTINDENDNPLGSFAWWAQGENSKVRLKSPQEEINDTDAATE